MNAKAIPILFFFLLLVSFAQGQESKLITFKQEGFKRIKMVGDDKMSTQGILNQLQGSNLEYYKLFRKGQTFNGVGWGIIFAEFIGAAFWIYNEDSLAPFKTSSTAKTTVIAGGVLAFCFFGTGINKKSTAVKLYNKDIQNSIGLNIGIQKHGLGLVLNY